MDDLGLRPVRYGSLPAACAALNNVQVNVQRLAVRAALDGDRSLVYAAVALGPADGCVAYPRPNPCRWSTGFSKRNGPGSARSPSRYGGGEVGRLHSDHESGRAFATIDMAHRISSSSR